MREFDYKAIEAKKSEQALEEFISSHEGLIIKTASKTSKHFVTKSDDEWSIALSAFAEAIEKYDLDKGGFMAFAELLIRRRLIDWFRSNGRFQAEVQIDDIEDEGFDTNSNDDLKLEILTLGDILKNYGYSFMDVADSSPKAEKTKESCQMAILWMIGNPIAISQLKETKQLPIKIIENNSRVPRKILERHRKYIIAAVEIATGDFPGLAEYVSFLRRR